MKKPKTPLCVLPEDERIVGVGGHRWALNPSSRPVSIKGKKEKTGPGQQKKAPQAKNTIGSNLDRYLEMTGQTFTDLMQGASDHGPCFILDELVPLCLKEKKKIIWKNRNLKLGLTYYKLVDI